MRIDDHHANEHGQTMAEYAVVLTVISLIIVSTIQLLSGNVGTTITRAAELVK